MPNLFNMLEYLDMEVIKKAIECHKEGDFTRAEEYYKLYLIRNPKEAKAHHLLGAMLIQKGDFENALISLKTAFDLENSVPIETDFALCCYKMQNYSAAFEHLKNVINANSDETLYDTMLICAKKLNLEKDCLKYLKSPGLHNNNIYKLREIAALAFEVEEYDISKDYYKKILEISPEDFIAQNNLGLSYEFLNDFENAEIAYEKSISIKPNFDAYYNLSILLKRKRKYKESLEMLLKAKKINQDFTKYNQAYGLLKLIQKDFSGYIPYIEYTRAKYKKDMEPWWNGSMDTNKTLVVCATEGYGDIIMFTRYLDFVDASKFKKVILIVPEALFELYAYNFPNFTVLKMGECNGISYNAGTILMELPLIYNLDFDHIPSADRYLLSLPEYTEKWQKRFNESKINIGVFFAGNTNNKRTLRNRKVPFKYLIPLFDLDANFYSLQPEGIFKEDFKGHNIVDLSGEIKNFSDTAAIIDKMDIVISVDSSVLHLSGALGKKTFLLLPYSADWRWFNDTKTTPWYDSVEIFKQEKEGDWNPVIENVKLKIQNYESQLQK